MRIYTDNAPKSWLAIVILVVAFFLAFPLGKIATEELTSNEGLYAAAVTELSHIQSFVTLHQRPSHDIMPLYPLLAKGLVKCGAPIEFALRFIPVASLAILAILTGLLCARSCDRLAGVVASLVSFSSYLAVYHAVDGFPHVTAALFLYTGWLLWYYFGQRRNRWNLAWISAGFASVAIFFLAGKFVLCCFLIPLAALQGCFIHEEHRKSDDFQGAEEPHPEYLKWHPLKSKAFFPVLILMLLALLCWSIPVQNASQKAPLELAKTVGFLDILTHFFTFPIDFISEILPWSLVIWLPFCPLFFSVEPNPPMMKCHRILLVSLSVILWLAPWSDTREIVYAIPLFSFLIGADYSLIVRKYSAYFFFGALACAIVSIFLNSVLITAFFFPGKLLAFYSPFTHFFWQFVPNFTDFAATHSSTFPIIAAAVSILVAVSAIFFVRRRFSPWIIIAFILIAFSLTYWQVVIPLKAVSHNKISLAQEIREAIDANTSPDSSLPLRLYKDSSIEGLYAECYYVHLPVFITAPGKLPDSFSLDDPVFMLTTAIPSSYTDKSWSLLLSKEYHGKGLYLYKGSSLSQTGGFPDELNKLD